jgi:acyl-CoA thioesterase I
MQLPPLNMLSYGRQYRKAFDEVADAEDIAFVPFLLEGVAMDRKMNGGDGIHPNAAGAKRIADTIWPHLQEVLRSLD